jgi:hypothetical protein
MWRGGLKCLALVGGVAAVLGFVFVGQRYPTAEANTLSQLGAAFLIAYGVQISWVVRETNQRNGFYEEWLGFITGLAVCGLSGIAIAAGLADFGLGTSALREVGFAWSCSSIVLLGAIVALAPILIYEWRRQLATELDDE